MSWRGNAEHLNRSFVGCEFNDSFLKELPAEVDPWGERGEFHTFTCDGLIFQHSVRVAVGEVVYRRYEQPAVRGKDDIVDDAAGEPRNGADRESYECGPPSGTDAQDKTTPGAAGVWYCDLLLA